MSKKIIAILLLATLILSLVACGQANTDPQNAEDERIPMASKEELEAFDAACALMESGDYVRAIDAFAGIPLYWEIQKKITEANRAIGGSVENNNDLTDPINPPNGEAVTIELTPDNWSDYFEVRQYEKRTYDRWNEPTSYCSSFAFFLKDEYTDRFVNSSGVENMTSLVFYVKTDIEVQSTLKDGTVYDGTVYDNILQLEENYELVFWLRDYRQEVDSNNGLSGYVAAVYDVGSSFYKVIINDFSRVIPEGTLTLQP